MRTIGRILSHESDSPRNVITCAYFLLCYSLPFCVWFVPPFVPYFDCDGRTAPRKCIRPMSPMQSEVGRRVADTAQRGSLDVKGTPRMDVRVISNFFSQLTYSCPEPQDNYIHQDIETTPSFQFMFT